MSQGLSATIQSALAASHDRSLHDGARLISGIEPLTESVRSLDARIGLLVQSNVTGISGIHDAICRLDQAVGKGIDEFAGRLSEMREAMPVLLEPAVGAIERQESPAPAGLAPPDLTVPQAAVDAVPAVQVSAMQATPLPLTLDADFGIDDQTWLDYLAKLIRVKLIGPLVAAGTPPPASCLWVCIDGTDESDEALAATLLTVDELVKASEYPVQSVVVANPSALSGGGLQSVQLTNLSELSRTVAASDLVLFVKAGDRIRPELHMALKFFGAFERDATIVDQYFHEAGRAFPVLQHGFDPTHLAAVDAVFSRFALSGRTMRRVQQVVRAIRPAELLHASMDAIESGLHIPLPLVCSSLNRAAVREAKVQAVRRLHGRSARERESAQSTTVAAVICTKDSCHLLRQLVRRLQREPLIREIVIVSNNSSNPFSLELLDELRLERHVTVLKHDGPFNFSVQCNLGARHANSEYLLFVNDDICPVSDQWLERLVEACRNQPAGRAIAGPLLLYPDQTVQHAGMFLGFNNVAGHALRHARVPDEGPGFQLIAPRRVGCLTGALLVMSRSVFDDLNGFDPLLATYLQDVDLSLRALRTDLPLILEPRSLLLHMESVSVKRILSDHTVSRTRGNEYTYFAKRWGELVASGDPWTNPTLDLSDESMRTLKEVRQ
jgi:GT2 family glycosyltransferase